MVGYVLPPSGGDISGEPKTNAGDVCTEDVVDTEREEKSEC